jgi:hypothetical protein
MNGCRHDAESSARSLRLTDPASSVAARVASQGSTDGAQSGDLPGRRSAGDEWVGARTGTGDGPHVGRRHRLTALRAGVDYRGHVAAAFVDEFDGRPGRRLPPVTPLAHGSQDRPEVPTFRREAVVEARRVLAVGNLSNTPAFTRWLRRWLSTLREMPRRSWKSSKRVTPKNASLTMSMLHHSPTASRHWAIEQLISRKLVRCTGTSLVSCFIECTPVGLVL